MILKGKITFKSIHWSFIFFTPLCVCFFLSAYFFSKCEELDLLKKRVEYIHQKAMGLKKKKEQEEQALVALKDSVFSEKPLENLLFLSHEIKKLQVQSELEESSKKRLRFLKDGDNQLRFIEEIHRKALGVKETELKQKYPVEVDDNDLKKILTLVEHLPDPSSPQSIIKKFSLEKKNIPLEDETVYLIHLDLVKRELSP